MNFPTGLNINRRIYIHIQYIHKHIIIFTNTTTVLQSGFYFARLRALHSCVSEVKSGSVDNWVICPCIPGYACIEASIQLRSSVRHLVDSLSYIFHE